MNELDMKRWIRKFNGPIVELNRLFDQYAKENHEAPQVYVFKVDPNNVGENDLSLDLTIIRNPSFQHKHFIVTLMVPVNIV